MMKHLAVLSFSFLALTTYGQNYGWINISNNLPSFPFDTTIINDGADTLVANISDLFFLNDDEGWIATSHPFDQPAAILHTIDGGTTWEVQTIEAPITAIEMLSPNEGYAAAFNGSIYHTNDGGTTWVFHAPTFALALTDMDFPPGSSTGYVVGMNGAVFRLTSGGIQLMTSGVVSDLKSVHFIDDDHGWFCGQSVMKEYKNGVWVAGHAYPSGTLNDVFFTDQMNGWVAGTFISFPIDTVGIIHTVNDSSWVTQPLGIGNTGDMLDVFFVDNQKGWAVGTSGKIFKTTDGGLAWTQESQELTSEFLRRVQFTSPTNGYIAGNKKTILKYTIISDVDQPAIEQAIKIYPNPASSELVITPPGGNKTIDAVLIFDVSGKLVLEKQSAGIHDKVILDTSTLGSGIYFCQIFFDGVSVARKVVLRGGSL